MSSSPDDLSRFLAGSAARVDAALLRLLPRPDDAGALAVAMRDACLAGGKRLRPALAFLGALDVGGSPDDALGAAVALELVHAYSLVHDDLPCMDDATLRRGRPCVHVVHGEALAVLAGDALLTLAFEVLAEHTPPGRPVAAMVGRLARGAGWAGMVGGQVEDLAAEGSPPDLQRVRRIHAGKTAALMSAALALGALAGGGGEAEVERLAAAGGELGLAFQIVDDLLDLQGEQAETGKDSGADAGRGKLTWPSVVGVDAARDDARRLLAAAVQRVAARPSEPLMAALAERLLARRS